MRRNTDPKPDGDLPCVGLYPMLLGSEWDRLAPSVRKAHAEVQRTRQGHLSVRHGPRLLARWLARCAALPPQAQDIATTVVILATPRGEEWRRKFGDTLMVTTQVASRGLLAERFGAVELRFILRIQEGALLFEQRAAFLCIGPLRVRLPRLLAPMVGASERPGDSPEHTFVEVRVSLPLVGVIVSYSGRMGPPEALP